MTTAVATPTPTATPARNRISRWTIVLLVGIADAVLGLVGVLATSGAVLVGSWVVLVAGVDLALLALWKARRTA